MMRFIARAVPALAVASFVCGARIGTAASAPDPGPALHLVPRPGVLVRSDCTGPEPSAVARFSERLAASGDTGAALLLERWRALGAVDRSPAPAGPFSKSEPERVIIDPGFPDTTRGAYTLNVTPESVEIRAASQEGAFYGLVTLAQLASLERGRWRLPCVHIEDRPALAWRILSDDISRGPLPTMRYFKERIRTIASFKMNGYAPYAEHVVFDPDEPLPSPLDGLTAAELTELDGYAKRYHVALIPAQQTFAHMHNSLRWEQYARLAETPHGYLLSPANPAGAAYAQALIVNQLAAVPRPPFFHIGADEPVDLGRGQAASLVRNEGEGPVYTRFVAQMAGFVASRGIRPMIWDDALERHPELFGSLPKSLVFVNWHYGDEATYLPFIRRIAAGGFDQMVAPGSRNWNEIYPDINGALGNIDRFVTEGKQARVFGLYQTVWHDDGETLFEATWLPVVYAAASGWESASVNRERFMRDFPAAFFGTGDVRFADDVDALAAARDALRRTGNSGDYLYWSDAFDPRFYGRVAPLVDAAGLRLQAERVIAHLRTAAPPPLHAQASRVMLLAARRYDQLGRNLQIAAEAGELYADAAAQLAAKNESLAERDLFLTKYLFWEQRDSFLELAPLVQSAWEYENRSSHELSVLQRYHLAADRAIARADAVNRAVYEDFEPSKTLPPFQSITAPQSRQTLRTGVRLGEEPE